jgi:hypothetical protein
LNEDLLQRDKEASQPIKNEQGVVTEVVERLQKELNEWKEKSNVIQNELNQK